MLTKIFTFIIKAIIVSLLIELLRELHMPLSHMKCLSHWMLLIFTSQWHGISLVTMRNKIRSGDHTKMLWSILTLRYWLCFPVFKSVESSLNVYGTPLMRQAQKLTKYPCPWCAPTESREVPKCSTQGEWSQKWKISPAGHERMTALMQNQAFSDPL